MRAGTPAIWADSIELETKPPNVRMKLTVKLAARGVLQPPRLRRPPRSYASVARLGLSMGVRP